MRFLKISVTFICFAFCLFSSMAFADDVVKIGVIDLQKILGTSDAGKAAQQKITEKGKELEADLKEKAAAITEEQERYEREAAVMSQEARAEKERELKIKKLDFEDLEEKYKSEFTAYNQELVNQFKADVLNAVEQIGKKEGYTLIIEKSSSGVVYAPSTIDLTDKVIILYNENYAKKSE
jgi:outer membrane protein